MHAFRTHTCADLTAANVGDTVRLSGWVHRIRDHGGVLFVDLRDHYGITQLLCDPDSPVFAEVDKVRSEWCIRIDGEVKARDASLVNPKLPTGEIEVFIRDIEVLGAAEELPLIVFGDQEYPEETRLRYRFLDLRREAMQRNMTLRADVVTSIRKRMWDQGFREYQTPIITASSPEGARDFLVPSRLHPGKFYALPQAPQQFKQLIMVADSTSYFQIAPCFRDEDPRADRSPTDFYQLDMEMSFVSQQDVFDTIQPVMQGVFEEYGGGARSIPTGRKSRTAMRRCGMAPTSPTCATRSRCRTCPSISAVRALRSSPSCWSRTAPQIRAIPAPGGGSRKFCDRMNAFAQKEGLPGMGYIFWRDQGDEAGSRRPAGQEYRPGAHRGDPPTAWPRRRGCGVFPWRQAIGVRAVAGKARVVIGDELGLTETDRFAFAWIVDFPMYEATRTTGVVDFSHNPFSMPQGGRMRSTGDPLDVLGYQYDLACNGYELVSGAIRNHKPEIMFKAFELAGYGEDEVRKRFGGMVNAFRFGAPPHGGCAAGIDRMVMLLADTANIREVIMFPMNQRAEDLMMDAPSDPSSDQLMELGLRVIPTED